MRAVVSATTSTRTRDREPSTLRCRPSCSSRRGQRPQRLGAAVAVFRVSPAGTRTPVDLPAHGRSSGRPLASIEALGDWIAGFLDAAGSAQAALVGHSMGSLAALECAARHPDRVSKLALVGTAAPMPVSELLLEAAKRNDHVACELITGWSYSAGKQLGGSQAPRAVADGQWIAVARTRKARRALRGSCGLQRLRRRRNERSESSLRRAGHSRRARLDGAGEGTLAR
jgi:pimeloyl-ACP methyl ester carboxylesterase